MPELRYIDDVVTLELDAGKCTGCRMCTEVCPHAVFALEDGKARIADRDACMECGACARNCPAEAISVSAGVGCATAIILQALSRDGKGSCCGDARSGGPGCSCGSE